MTSKSVVNIQHPRATKPGAVKMTSNTKIVDVIEFESASVT